MSDIERRWIEFVEVPQNKIRRTKVWAVRVKDGGNELGFVSWFSHWRKYAFNPYANTVYEEDCLRVIADFCEAETRRHKENKKKGRRDDASLGNS